MNAAIDFSRRPAARGRFWLSRAFTMFRAHSGVWLMLLITYYLLTLFVQLLPFVGALAWVILKPVFAVGFLAAAWSQERGEPPKLLHLFKGFQSNLWALMPLGLFFVAGIALAIMASWAVDGGKLVGIATGTEKLTEELLRGGGLQLGMLFSAVCALPVVLALWFAPALVVFHDAGALAALSTSLRACLTNWRPVLVYGALVVFYTVVVPSIAGALMRMLPPAVVTVFTVVVVMPYLFIFMATLHVSDYVSYRDIFHPENAGDAGVSPPGPARP